jgi:hypothetical protein
MEGYPHTPSYFLYAWILQKCKPGCIPLEYVFMHIFMFSILLIPRVAQLNEKDQDGDMMQNPGRAIHERCHPEAMTLECESLGTLNNLRSHLALTRHHLVLRNHGDYTSSKIYIVALRIM